MLMGVNIIFLYFILRPTNTDILVEQFAISVIVCIFLGIVFYRRTLRFNESRVKVVLRTYISVQVKKNKDLQVKDL